MKGRQSFMRFIYPLLMKLSKLSGKNSHVYYNKNRVAPAASFYQLCAVQNNGHVIDMASFQGKKVLLVNTASDCGYTAQYAQLQQLQEQYPHLVILGFPANDFNEQESGDDKAIAQFCQVNFGVKFPLMKKSIVIKSEAQEAIYQWLSDATRNGWNNHAPEWNFGKYLVDEQGVLQSYFGPAISPLSRMVTRTLQS